MRQTRSILGAALFIALAVHPSLADAPEGRLFTSILPQKYLVQRIAGPDFEVEALVGPGQSPETFEPGPRAMSRLSEARALFPLGVPFEKAWLPKIRESMKSLRIYETTRSSDDFEREHSHPGHEEGMDPHLWTSLTEVIAMLPGIRDALIELAPQGREGFLARASELETELRALDAEFRVLFKGKEGRRFMVFHPAWGHFAETYGLEQIAIEESGKEPGARALAAKIEIAKRLGIKTIFVQQQFSRDAAEAVARSVGAELVPLDPLSEDYIENLRRCAGAISEALR